MKGRNSKMKGNHKTSSRLGRAVRIALAALLLLPLLSGCGTKTRELEWYLNAAYPDAWYARQGEYYIRSPEGADFAVASRDYETGGGAKLLIDGVGPAQDCACAVGWYLLPEGGGDGSGMLFGIRPVLQVLLDGAWRSVPSADLDLHPDGISHADLGAQRYILPLLSRETGNPLPEGKYRLALDLGPAHGICCSEQFELAYAGEPLSPTGEAAAFPESLRWLRNAFGDLIVTDRDGSLWWQNGAPEGFFVEYVPALWDPAGDPDPNSEGLHMDFSGFETPDAPEGLSPGPAAQDGVWTADDWTHAGAEARTNAVFTAVNRRGSLTLTGRSSDGAAASSHLQVLLEGRWWTIPWFRPGDTPEVRALPEGESRLVCSLRSRWTGQRLPEGRYRYCFEAFDPETDELICLTAEFELGR